MDPTVSMLVADYFLRALHGEEPDVNDYRDQAGGAFAQFTRVLDETLSERPVVQDKSLDEGGVGVVVEGYRTLAYLGSGSYGDVFRAWQVGLSREVALKVLHQRLSNTEARQRFEAGAAAAAQVEHDHAARIFDHGIANTSDRPYIVMGLLRGPTWSDAIGQLHAEEISSGVERDHVLDRLGIPGVGRGAHRFSRRIAMAFVGVAEALAAYHHVGIVHRDVKPSNLILDAKGRLVLTDFDLAKTELGTSLTQHGDMLGSPSYMSPEQWRGDPKRLDGRSDIYGLGAVMYETLSGQRIHGAAESLADVRTCVTRGSIAPLASVTPTIAPAIAQVIHRALEVDPRDRYADARALADDLRKVAQGREIRMPSRRFAKAARFAKRHWVASAVVVAMLGLGTVWWTTFRRGTLHVVPETLGGGEVYVDGVACGGAPLRGHKLSPGSHEVRWESPYFHSWSQRCRIRSGDEVQLAPAEQLREDAPELVREMVALVRASARAHHRVVRSRASPVAWLPRGNVTKNDVVALTVAMPPGTYGTVAMDVYGSSFQRIIKATDAATQRIVIPEDIRGRLRPGQTYTWNVLDMEGEEAGRATFTVMTDADPKQTSASLAIVDRATQALPEERRAFVLYTQGRYTAALETLRHVPRVGRLGRAVLEAARRALGLPLPTTTKHAN